MKATIDFAETLYRRLKVEAARSGRAIRDLVDERVRHVLGLPAAARATPEARRDPPAWFGMLRGYAPNAEGGHDLAAMRRSIARGRSRRGA